MQGPPASTVHCWLDVSMHLADPTISQSDQGFSAIFLGSRQMMSWYPNTQCSALFSTQSPDTGVKIFCPNTAFPHILSLWSSPNGNFSKIRNFVPIYCFSLLHTRTFHFPSPPSGVLCHRLVFNGRTTGHNPRNFGVVINYLFPPPVINVLPRTKLLLLLLLLLFSMQIVKLQII